MSGKASRWHAATGMGQTALVAVSYTHLDVYKRQHRGMVGWESKAIGMGAEIGQPQGLRVDDEQAQYPLPGGSRADPLLLVLLESDREELGKRGAVVVQDPECTVSSARHRASLVDDVPKQGRELHVLFEQQRGFEHPTELGRILDGVVWHALGA